MDKHVEFNPELQHATKQIKKLRKRIKKLKEQKELQAQEFESALQGVSGLTGILGAVTISLGGLAYVLWRAKHQGSKKIEKLVKEYNKLSGNLAAAEADLFEAREDLEHERGMSVDTLTARLANKLIEEHEDLERRSKKSSVSVQLGELLNKIDLD